MSDSVRSHQTSLWQMILRSGILENPDPAIEEAFFASPRHHFVQTYRPWWEKEWVAISDGPLTDHLDTIYRDEPLVLKGDSEFYFESSCSQPSFILNLTDWLDVKAGQNVLEIGSGCGWLAAILSHLAGSDGHVTGVEIIEDLAEQSRRNLIDHANITIHIGDGNSGYSGNAPYDRIIFTTGLYDLPKAFFDQIKPGGLLLAPIRMAGHGNVIHLFRREEDRFTSLRAIDGYFVPMKGQPADGEIMLLHKLPFWKDLQNQPATHQAMWWGAKSSKDRVHLASSFRAALKVMEPETRGYDLSGLDAPLLKADFAFGLVTEHSACLINTMGIQAYGKPDCYERIMTALCKWLDLGMPPGSAFPLNIYPAGTAPAETAQYTACRGNSLFSWGMPQ